MRKIICDRCRTPFPCDDLDKVRENMVVVKLCCSEHYDATYDLCNSCVDDLVNDFMKKM